MSTRSSLLELMRGVPRATAIIDGNNNIMDCNAPFIAMLGNGRGRNALEYLSDGVHKDPLRHILSAVKPGWRGDEITLTTPGGATLCWCEVHSLHADAALVHFLEISSMQQMRAFEAAQLQRVRRVADDNLWIINEAGILLWMRVENPAYTKFLRQQACELVQLEDRAIWEKTLQEAKSLPPERFAECTVRAVIDGKSRFVDISYVGGGIVGGRYYAASRGTEPSGCRIVRRLKEAWGVHTNKQLAASMGTSESMISDTNKSETVPPHWITKTGDATGFSLDWLWTGHGPKRRI